MANGMRDKKERGFKLDDKKTQVAEAAKVSTETQDENEERSRFLENLPMIMLALIVSSLLLMNSYRTPSGYIVVGDWYVRDQQFCGLIYDGWRGDIDAVVMNASGTGYGTIVSAEIDRRFNYSGWRKTKYGFEVGKRRFHFTNASVSDFELSLAHDEDDSFAVETTETDVLSFLGALYNQNDISFYTFDDQTEKLRKHNYLTVSEKGKREAIDLFFSCVREI